MSQHDEEGLPFSTDRATSVDDIATQVEEREREAALAAHRDRAAAAPKLIGGRCNNCGEQHTESGETFDDEQEFCDADCRDDFEKRAAARRRNGKA